MDSLLLPLGILITVKAFRTEIPLAKGRGKKSGITHGNTAGFCTKKVIAFHDSCIRSIYLGRKFNHPVFIVDFRHNLWTGTHAGFPSTSLMSIYPPLSLSLSVVPLICNRMQ